MSADPAAGEPDATSVPRSILLNAVSEAIADGPSGVIGDERSESLIREVYTEVTTADGRDRFETALREVQSEAATETEDGLEDGIFDVLDAIQGELLRREIALEVRHENGFELAPSDLAIYRFIRSGDPDELRYLSFDAGDDQLDAGLAGIETGAYEDAIAALGTVIDRIESAADRSRLKTLYAYALTKAGRYEESLSVVEEVLESDDDAWLPNLVGPVAAQEDPARFDDGDLSVEPFLRITAEIPDETSLRVWYGRDTEGEVFWDRLTGDLEHLPVPALADRNHLRLVLRGTPDTMPTLHTYYVGLGVVDTGADEAKTVDHVFVDGPITGGGTETIRLIE